MHLNTKQVGAYAKRVGVWNESAGAESVRINTGNGANADNSEEDLGNA